MRIIKSIILLASILIALTLTVSLSSIELTESAFANDTQTIKIGVIVPLSGFIASYGQAAQNSIKLLQTDQGDSDSKKIKFIFEDSEYEANQSISAFNKLVLTDKVNLVFVWGSTPSAVVAPIAERMKVPTIVFTGDPQIVAKKHFIIDSSDRLTKYSEILLTYLRSKGYKKFGILKTELQYLEALLKGMQDNLQAGESITVVDSFPPDPAVNLNSSIVKVKQSINKGEFDALGILLSTGQLASFYQKMSLYKINIPTFGSDFLLQQDENIKAGPAIIGAVFPTHDLSQDFIKKYRDKFSNTELISSAAHAYDLADLIYKIFDNLNNSSTAEEILNKIKLTTNIKGVIGEIKFINEDPKTLADAGMRYIFPIVMKEVLSDGSVAVVK